MPTAIDVSSVAGLTALGMFTAQILMGLLLSVGYNPIRQWPRQRWIKLFTFHNWLGYLGLATAVVHPLILLLSSDAGFHLFDIFVRSRIPWTTFIESLVYHALVLVAVLSWAQWRPRRHITQVDPWKDTKLVVYPSSQPAPLPKLDTGSAGHHHAQTGDPVLAAQPILSVPREPDNRAQTIITPPDIVLHSDVQMPNIVAWTATPVAAAPTLTVLASERTVLSPALTVIAPAPAVPEAQQHDRPTLDTAVVPPPPTLDASRALGTMNLGPTAVVAPAPSLPVSEQQTRQQGPSLASAVVPPPPSMASAGTGSPNRLIALSLSPSAPPPTPPTGNRRGEFSATPQGNPQGSGRPAITETSRANNPSTGAAATTPGLPPGIRIDDPPSGNSTEGPQSFASITIDRHPIAASIPPPRVSTASRKPAVLSEREPTQTERKVFGPRRFYTMMLNMPNLNSAGGTWIVRFAELKAGDEGQLFSPLLTLKSDPAYPSELQRANVQGTVTLRAIIHSDGSVREIRVLDGADDRLDHYASEALARCHFEPAIKNGLPVALEAVVAIPFRARKEF